MQKNVILVGHCGIDGPRIAETVTTLAPHCSCESIRSTDDLRSCLADKKPDLVLFNRELPPGFDERTGPQLIQKLKQEYPDVPMMLVSDYAEAQDEAVKSGALPGFGKAELQSPRVADLLKSHLS